MERPPSAEERSAIEEERVRPEAQPSEARVRAAGPGAWPAASADFPSGPRAAQGAEAAEDVQRPTAEATDEAAEAAQARRRRDPPKPMELVAASAVAQGKLEEAPAASAARPATSRAQSAASAGLAASPRVRP